MMRKTMWQIPVALITALGLAAAPAAASKGRSAEATYSFDVAEGGSVWVADENVAFTSAETTTFETTRADRTVSLEVADDSAATVAAAVWQEGAPSTIFCDEVASVPITGGKPVFVRVMVDITPAPSLGCTSPEMPTTGTVTALFAGGGKRKGQHHHHH